MKVKELSVSKTVGRLKRIKMVILLQSTECVSSFGDIEKRSFSRMFGF